MNMSNKIFVVALALFLGVSACGKLGTVEHEGTINAKVSIDEEQLRRYFGNYCARQLGLELGMQPTQAQIDTCTDNWVADFLAAITTEIKPSPTPIH